MNLKNLRYVLWGLVIVAGIAATIYSLIPRERGFGQIDFALVDHNGAPITQAAFKGQPTLLFFGFTHCPDVCPTSMSEIAYIIEGIGAEAKSLRAFFVSVDPARDSPEVLKDYATAFSDQITGITGDPAEIERLKTAWGIYAEKVPLSDGGYTMDHTASIFLVDSKGEFQGTIGYGEDLETAEAKVRRLIAGS